MIDTFLFIRRDQVLSPAALSAAISALGYDLKIPADFDPAPDEPVFLKCYFEGLDSGFELSASPFQEPDWGFEEEDMAKIRGSDLVLQFTTYSNAQEVAGAVVAVGAYAAATSSVIGDEFFEERLIDPGESAGWVADRLPNAREQFNGPSKLRD